MLLNEMTQNELTQKDVAINALIVSALDTQAGRSVVCDECWYGEGYCDCESSLEIEVADALLSLTHKEQIKQAILDTRMFVRAYNGH